jgi:type IV secretory pathway TraG/TraD family ATPase VirD4
MTLVTTAAVVLAAGLGLAAGPLWLANSTPTRDRRDRYGFAAARQLRKEGSVSAARRRAAQTRPSLARVSSSRVSGHPKEVRAVQGLAYAGRSGRARQSVGWSRAHSLAGAWRRGRLPAREVGYPLGRVLRTGTQLWPSWEASLRLVAPPGEGKTFRVLVPILRQHPGPALATSTKSDLYELTAGARECIGPVFALDPDLLVPAAVRVRWSPVAGCEHSVVAERRAAALVAAAGDEGEVQNGAFFRDSARDLLKAYLHAAALEGLDIRAVIAWSRRPDDPTPADVLACSHAAAPGWADLVVLHTTGAAETTSGVLRYVGRALACFSHEAVVEACCPPPDENFDVEALLVNRGTVYLMGKGSRLGAVAPLITAFADEVFECAERLAAMMPGRRLDPPLLGLLDEAPTIAPLPTLPDILADGRGRGIVMVYAMQSFSQAVTRWGPQRAQTMGNATSITAVLGGLKSPNDLADLEKLCGQRHARRVASHQGVRDRSRTVSWDYEAVLRADQIRTLPTGVGLLLWGRLPPVLAHFPLLTEHVDWPRIQEEERRAREANDRARGSQARMPAGRSAAVARTTAVAIK